MVKVNRRGGFSDRQGIKVENTEIQLKDLDNRTRVQIYSMIGDQYSTLYSNHHYSEGRVRNFFRYIKGQVFCEPLDASNIIDDEYFFDEVNEVIMKASYDDVLTLVEAIVEYWEIEMAAGYTQGGISGYPFRVERYSICEKFNELFKREYVGYRFINKEISPISDETEINTIEETLKSEYDAVTNHISKAHSLLSDREHPDYENSIKESISSVEAMCEIITGVRGKEATLGNMLKKLEQGGVVIHSALKSAFNILYGYTCDANGIRHAGDIGGEASTFEEAKFMLVSCCAFINYLKGVTAD